MAAAKTPMNKGKGLESSSTNERPQPQPHFFEIPIKPLSEGIMIPALFMRRHGKLLDKNTVFLRVPGGPEWKVGLEVINRGETWMKKGVHEFGEYYYIRKFHLLVFKYEGNSRFLVTIFDITQAEIDYDFRSKVESVYPDGVGSSTAPATAAPQSVDFRSRVDSVYPDGAGPSTAPAAPQSPISGKEKLLECERNFLSEFPFFAVLLKPTNAYYPYTVHIPKGFMRANFGNKVLKDKGWLSLYLRVAGEKTNWPVIVYKHRMCGRFSSTGWKQIVQEQGMKEGEVCIFELVKSENAFNVYRFP